MCNDKLLLHLFPTAASTLTSVHFGVFVSCNPPKKAAVVKQSSNCKANRNSNCSCSVSLLRHMFQPAGALSIVICHLCTSCENDASTCWNLREGQSCPILLSPESQRQKNKQLFQHMEELLINTTVLTDPEADFDRLRNSPNCETIK